MMMRLVPHDGRPFAYAQDYDVHTLPQEHLNHLPEGSRGFDSFIGEPDMVGIGHGSASPRQLAELLIAEGAPIVAVDPDAENVRARRAYAKAGFRLTGIVETREGQVALMIFDQVPPTSKASPCC